MEMLIPADDGENWKCLAAGESQDVLVSKPGPSSTYQDTANQGARLRDYKRPTPNPEVDRAHNSRPWATRNTMWFVQLSAITVTLASIALISTLIEAGGRIPEDRNDDRDFNSGAARVAGYIDFTVAVNKTGGPEVAVEEAEGDKSPPGTNSGLTSITASSSTSPGKQRDSSGYNGTLLSHFPGEGLADANSKDSDIGVEKEASGHVEEQLSAPPAISGGRREPSQRGRPLVRRNRKQWMQEKNSKLLLER